MSHVDDGTLHAFLDGELTPVEVERLQAHVVGCTGCRTRLDEERALIERAARLLGVAVPAGPERAAPPLHQLRHSRPSWWQVRVPLAWAATIVLAAGLGWYAASLAHTKGESAVARFVAAAPQAPAPLPLADKPIQGRLSTAADAERGTGAAAPATPGALADRSAAEEADERQAPARPDLPTSANGQLSRSAVQPSLRESAKPGAVASNTIVIAPSAEGFASRDAVRRLSTTWPVIEAKPARDLLGADPVVLPGYDVRTLRRNPGAQAEIVVEQEIARGVVVSLFERPINQEAPMLIVGGRMMDSVVAKTGANERLARFIKGLRIEIAGPLPMDSLSKLLELITP